MNCPLVRCLPASRLLIALPLTRAADLPLAELTVVSSTVHNGYEREKLPDGSFKPIRYSFGEGTCDVGKVADTSLERLNFRRLIRVLSAPLAEQGFHPSRNANEVDQLIVVHWGRTAGWDGGAGYGNAYGILNRAHAAMTAAFPTNPTGPAPNAPPTTANGGTPGAAADFEMMMISLRMADDARALLNAENAQMLGYYDTLKRLPAHWGNLGNPDRNDLIDEIEDDRYYVILAAYDFQVAKKEQKPKVLWVTRFSLQARGANFDESVDRMVRAAAGYFGRPTNGLHREGMREARAIPGKLEVIDYQEPTK
ncbi:MAG: hypothetical protein HYV96_15105 [Opitutae bacterium]|nr:hypothetical protein [Opitutae bacterium]